MNDSVSQTSRVADQARLLIERGRFEQARTLLGNELRVAPQDVELLFLCAWLEYLADQAGPASAAVHAVLARDPAHFGARDIQARLLENQKRFAEAERIWIDLLREAPEDPHFYAMYATLMLRTLNLDKARRLAIEGLRYEPEHPGCLFVVALADLITGRGAGANASLETLVREHPEQERTALALIVTLQDRGDLRGALAIAQELLRSRPDSADYLGIVRELKAHAHWSMLPLYPMQRWGWGAIVALWVLFFVGIRALDGRVPSGVLAGITFLWLGYVVYSWVWPAVLRKLV